MEEIKTRSFECKDGDGNIMRLVLEPQKKYPGRFELKYIFNTKIFRLQHFSSSRDACNMWDLLGLISKKQCKGDE